MPGSPTRHAHRAVASLILAMLCCVWAAHASATESSTGPSESSHVLIGMLPRTGFEVTCDDSLLSDEPVVSDELGIVWFTIDHELHGERSVVSIRVPAPPQITGCHASVVDDTFAVIAWQTDRPAVSLVEYGTTPLYGQATPLSQRYTRTHAITVQDLSPETTYHYRAVSTDAFGHSTTADGRTLTTLAARPRIAGLAVETVSPTGLLVTWRTTRPCDARIEYGTDEQYGEWSAHDPTLALEHAVVLDGLEPYTLYHFRAWSTDEFGRAVNSGDRTAMTLPPELLLLQVAVVDTNSTTATVAWSTTTPATSQVEYGPTGDYGEATDVSTDLVTDHVVVLDGLTPDATYHFRVRSTDAHGQQVISPDGVFVTHAPGLPEALVIYIPSVGAVGWNSARVNWLTNLPSSSRVEYGTTPAYGAAVTDGALRVTHSVVLPDLEEETLYHFRILSTTAGGTTATTSDAVFTTLARPLEIENLTVAGVGDTQFTVNWTTTRPANGLVEYGTDGSYGASTPPAPEMSLTHSVAVTGLAPGTTYHFRARSEDETGAVALSDDSTVATAPLPLAVFDVSVSDTTDTAVVVEWRTNNPATSQVEYGTTASYGSATPEDLELSYDHAVILEGLTPNTEYHFRALSTDAYSQEAESPDAVFSTLPEGAGALVLWSIAAVDVGPTYALISWRTNRPASSTVEYGATAQYGTTEFRPDRVRNHSVMLTGLAEATTYHFRVRSAAATGPEAVSDDMSFTTAQVGDLMPPATPHGLAVLSRVGGITLGWEANTEQDLYQYVVSRRAEGAAEYAEIARPPAHQTSCIDDAAIPGLLYEYTVAAVDGSGNRSAPSAPVQAIAVAGQAGGLWAYPNPSHGSVSIRFSVGAHAAGGSTEYVVAVHDAAGRIVRVVARGETPAGHETVSWDGMDSDGRRVPSGVYFVSALFPQGQCRSKVIVAR